MTMIDPEAAAVIVRSAAAETLGNPDHPLLCGCSPTLPPPAARSARNGCFSGAAPKAQIRKSQPRITRTGVGRLLPGHDGDPAI